MRRFSLEKALTLVEVWLAIFVLSIGIGALVLIYPQLMSARMLEEVKVRAWEIARAELEVLRVSLFESTPPFSVKSTFKTFDPDSHWQSERTPIINQVNLTDFFNATNPNALRVLPPEEIAGIFAGAPPPPSPPPPRRVAENYSAVFYVQRLRRRDNNTVIPNLALVEVVVCYRAERRIVGEDTNLNNYLDPGEDINGDGRISSPVTLRAILGRFK